MIRYIFLIFVICSNSVCASHKVQFNEFKTLADKGYPYAILVLGRMYKYGKAGVTLDLGKAKDCFEEAYEKTKGSLDNTWVSAAVELGLLYMEGKGVSKNIPKAKDYFEEAKKAWSARAMYFLGYLAENSSNYDQAVSYYIEAIENGYHHDLHPNYQSPQERLESLVNDGSLSYDKRIMANAILERHERIKNFMDTGSISGSVNQVSASRNISAGTDNSNQNIILSTPKNTFEQIIYGRQLEAKGEPQKALYWYSQAAYSDHPLAQEILGNIYSQGRLHLETNHQEALKWFSIASSNPQAGHNVSFYAGKVQEMKSLLSIFEVYEAQREAQTWVDKNR